MCLILCQISDVVMKLQMMLTQTVVHTFWKCHASPAQPILSGSNIPSSGIFRCQLRRAVSLVLLPSEWREIPVKHVIRRSQQMDHQAFEGNYTFFSNVLRKFNPYCCWVFKKNYIKKRIFQEENIPLLAW